MVNILEKNITEEILSRLLMYGHFSAKCYFGRGNKKTLLPWLLNAVNI